MRWKYSLPLFLLGCMPVRDPAVPSTPVQDRIEVSLPGERQMSERVKAAFVQDGLQIASADPSLIASVPVTYRPGAAFPSEYTYRGVVISDSAVQRVVLSATLHTLKQGDYSTTAPLTSVCKQYPTHECNEAWVRLERLADRIRKR